MEKAELQIRERLQKRAQMGIVEDPGKLVKEEPAAEAKPEAEEEKKEEPKAEAAPAEEKK